MDVREYSPTDVIMTFGGASVTGWEKIVVRRNNPTFKVVEGIRGQNTRVRNLNSSATVEIVLAQTSPTNYIFSQIVELDERYGTARIEMTIKDTLTGETFSTQDAFLEKPSDMSWEEDLSERTWIMHCMRSTFIAGRGGALGSLVDRVAGFF